MKKAILINPQEKSFTEIEIGDDFNEINEQIGSMFFDVVNLDEKNDVYVDDEGLYNIDSNSMFFGFKGSNTKLAGKGVVLGIDHETGDALDTTLTIDQLKEMVVFYNYNETYPYLLKIGFA